MNKKLAVLGLGALAGALSGCVSFEAPPLEPQDVPEQWQGPLPEGATVWPNTDWWNNFNSPELTRFIEEVKVYNFDLANNRRTLEQAQMTLREAGLARWPQPSLSISDGASYQSSRVNGTTVNEGSNTNPTSLSFSASFSGVLTKPATYARALTDYDSRIAQAADAAMNTLGTAASTYFQLLLTRDQLIVTRQNLETAEFVGRIAEARLRAGVSVPIDALQQQIAIESQRNSLRSQEHQERQTLASLGILVGRHLQGFDVEGRTLNDIEVPRVQPGLPSELLHRRPDLFQAEMSLRGNVAQLSIVRKQLFPNISLTSSANASSRALNELLTSPASNSFSISMNLVYTLLDTGQRKRAIRNAEIALEAGLMNYRRTVLQAFNEVELALYNIELLDLNAAVAQSNLRAAEEQFRIAQVRYEQGVADYQTVLTAQNTLFNNRQSVLSNKQQRLNAVLNFYQSIGGGWEPGMPLEVYGLPTPPGP